MSPLAAGSRRSCGLGCGCGCCCFDPPFHLPCSLYEVCSFLFSFLLWCLCLSTSAVWLAEGNKERALCCCQRHMHVILGQTVVVGRGYIRMLGWDVTLLYFEVLFTYLLACCYSKQETCFLNGGLLLGRRR